MAVELRGKRVIITGASSGIGRALATAFAAAGARVVLAARSTAEIESAANEITAAGGDAIAISTDICDPAAREHLIAETVRRFGGLDILVNNAGVAAWGHFQTSTEAINRSILETNFFAPAELIRLAVPHLTRGADPTIVNVTSMTGRRGMPAWPEYSASKAALVGLSEALRGEMARFDISVVTVVPGLTKSDLNRHLLRNDGRADLPFDKGMEPAYVAARIVDAARRRTTELVLGGEAKKLLLFNKFAPRLLNRLVNRRIRKLYA